VSCGSLNTEKVKRFDIADKLSIIIAAMNKLMYLIIIYFVCEICKAQNLVPNGSFETISSCPITHGQLDLAVPWFVPNKNNGTPDLFNACNQKDFGVPINSAGYQNAHTGVGYAGFYTYGANSAREYLEVQLTSPLTAGIAYRIEMYVSPSENAGVAIDAIGIYISNGRISNSDILLPFVPQISNPINIIISDTLGWTLVSGLYIAAGGENYITIGNFSNDNSTNILNFNPSGKHRGYYFVDDVSISVVTSIKEPREMENISIYPNPFSTRINVTAFRNELNELILCDITGRQIHSQSFIKSISINTEQLANGIYFYKVRNRIGIIKKGKIVKS
jgi:hypothetical protein